MDIKLPGKTLLNLAKINIIIGKNGCGKSRILRDLDTFRDGWTHVKYITPERGGYIIYQPHIEQNIQNDVGLPPEK